MILGLLERGCDQGTRWELGERTVLRPVEPSPQAVIRPVARGRLDVQAVDAQGRGSQEPPLCRFLGRRDGAFEDLHRAAPVGQEFPERRDHVGARRSARGKQ
jgi:hypothetical protein